MALYQRASLDTDQLIERVMKEHHYELFEAGVLIQTLMASPKEDAEGQATGPAITVNGYPCAASIKIYGHEDRVCTGFDSRMRLDADEWAGMTERQREALVDHELCHLELVYDAKGHVKRDDTGRPRMTGRKHDKQFGWFDSTARRYGEDSPEVRQCRAMLEQPEFRQTYLFDTGAAA